MTIRIALVGCGRIAQNHLASIQALGSEFRLVGVCDERQDRLDAVRRDRNIPGYRSLEKLLANETPEVVSLCTPSGIHPMQGIQAAGAGVHVITEKPMATRYEHGKALVEACDSAGVKLFVVKQNRLNATVCRVKQALDEGRFGRLYSLSGNVYWTRPQAYYDQARWRGTWELDGGAFMNQASHYVDLVTHLGGPLESVFAYGATLARRIEAEDSGVIAYRFRSGAMGSLNVSMLAPLKNFEGSLTLVGEKGLARLGGVALNEITAWEFVEPKPEDEGIVGSGYETTSVYGFGHQAYYAEVAKALRGEPNAATTGREGLVSLSTLVGAYRSILSGTPVGFPLDM